MKNNRIIIVFIIIVISMIGGFYVYNHNQKVNLAKYYYDIGEYQKASNLKVGEISNNALHLYNIQNWKNSLKYESSYDKASSLILDISSVHSDIILSSKTNVPYINKSKDVYMEISNYLNVPESKLDEIVKMDMNDGILELTRILNKI